MQQNYKITVLSIIKALYAGCFLIIPIKDKPTKCQLLQVTIFMIGFSSSMSVYFNLALCLTALFKNTHTLKFKCQLTFAFSAAVILSS